MALRPRPSLLFSYNSDFNPNATSAKNSNASRFKETTERSKFKKSSSPTSSPAALLLLLFEDDTKISHADLTIPPSGFASANACTPQSFKMFSLKALKTPTKTSTFVVVFRVRSYCVKCFRKMSYSFFFSSLASIRRRLTRLRDTSFLPNDPSELTHFTILGTSGILFTVTVCSLLVDVLNSSFSYLFNRLRISSSFALKLSLELAAAVSRRDDDDGSSSSSSPPLKSSFPSDCITIALRFALKYASISSLIHSFPSMSLQSAAILRNVASPLIFLMVLWKIFNSLFVDFRTTVVKIATTGLLLKLLLLLLLSSSSKPSSTSPPPPPLNCFPSSESSRRSA